jgi:hypothetical protein
LNTLTRQQTVFVGRLLASELWAFRSHRTRQCPEELSERLHDLGLWSPRTFRKPRTAPPSCALNSGCLPVSSDYKRCFVPYRGGRGTGQKAKSRDVNNHRTLSSCVLPRYLSQRSTQGQSDVNSTKTLLICDETTQMITGKAIGD